MTPMVRIRPYEDRDWPAVWRVLEPIFRAGETYPYARDITEEDARHAWTVVPTATYVAAEKECDEIAGTYYIKPNQPPRGAHVCNGGYAVAEHARGKGVGMALGKHALTAAAKHGFRAMQFNLVVATNTASIRLWKRLGFTTIGTLPGAFNHPAHGYVDAYVMYRELG